MKTFEVTFEDGTKYSIRGEDWKKGTEKILEDLKIKYPEADYGPWNIVSILTKEE
jgi:hypothetical protein|tara:strand:- start:399 stop:563 length:165 start_codon:yes stop_codon:yes gene_type:complete